MMQLNMLPMCICGMFVAEKCFMYSLHACVVQLWAEIIIIKGIYRAQVCDYTVLQVL